MLIWLLEMFLFYVYYQSHSTEYKLHQFGYLKCFCLVIYLKCLKQFLTLQVFNKYPLKYLLRDNSYKRGTWLSYLQLISRGKACYEFSTDFHLEKPHGKKRRQESCLFIYLKCFLESKANQCRDLESSQRHLQKQQTDLVSIYTFSQAICLHKPSKEKVPCSKLIDYNLFLYLLELRF